MVQEGEQGTGFGGLEHSWEMRTAAAEAAASLGWEAAKRCRRAGGFAEALPSCPLRCPKGQAG